MPMEFFLFWMPFALIRLRFSHKSSLGLGISSDIAAATQLCLLSSLSPALFFFLLAFFVPYSLFDALLQKASGTRMRFSLFHHLRQAKNFWGSAKELGIVHFMVISLGWSIASLAIAMKISPTFPPTLLAVVALFFLLICGFLGMRNRIESYQTLNVLILEEYELVKSLFRKKEIIEGTWKPKQEKYLQPCSELPLYRLTQEFTGDKHFSLDLQEGERPHIVFIVLESFRAKSVSACDVDAPQQLTPCFNTLAKEGVLWRQFYCASARSCKALIASLFGISSKKDDEVFKNNPNFPMRGLPEILKEQHYYNVLLQGGDLEFDRIREVCDAHQFDIVEGAQEIAAHYQHETKESFWGLHDEFLMRRAVALLKESDQLQRPSFLNVYTISNHHPWRLPPGESEKEFYKTDNEYEKRFQQTIHYTDRCLGMFVEELKKAKLLDKTLLFILGDHGQPFSEHNDRLLDREGLYEEHVWIPLLMLAEGRGIKPQVIEEPASQQDLLPTVLDLLRLPAFHHALGRSLIRHSPEATVTFQSPFFPPRLGLRRERWKWIMCPESNEEELYNLFEDPGERRNLIEHFPLIAENLRKEGLFLKNFLEMLFEKKRFILSKDMQEEKVIDLCGREDLCESELKEIIARIPPTSLKLDHCTSVTDKALESIACHCARLKTLSLRNCLHIGESGLEAVFRQAKNLRHLDVSHCLLLNSFDSLASHVASLHRLSLDGMGTLEKDLLPQFLKGMPHLRNLSLVETSVSDEDLDIALRTCKELKFLKADARLLTDRALRSIAECCPNLTSIHLSGCLHMTDAGLSQLRACYNLTSAILIDCPNISGMFLEDWKRLFLHTIYFRNFPSFEEKAISDILEHPIKQLQLHEFPNLTDLGLKSLEELGAKEIHVVECDRVSRAAIDQLRTKTGLVFWN